MGAVLLHGPDQLEDVDRLREVPVEPGAEELLTVPGHGLRGQSQDRNRCGLLVSPQSCEGLDSVDPGELDVHEDEGRGMCPSHFDRLFAGSCLERRVPGCAEYVA